MSNILDTYALLTADEGRDALELGDTFDQNDTLILFINGISSLIERICERKFKSRSFTELFDGDGTNRKLLKNGLNTTAITTVVYDYASDDDMDNLEVPSASIKYNGAIGEVYLDNGYAFHRGFQNCSVTYTAGETSIPSDIKIAAILILKDFWSSSDKQTQVMSSMSAEGQTINFEKEDIPRRARKILELYTRPRIA